MSSCRAGVWLLVLGPGCTREPVTGDRPVPVATTATASSAPSAPAEKASPSAAPAPEPTAALVPPVPSGNCGIRPSDWCPAPAGDPCGRHADVAACRADASCGGMRYRGESVVRCLFDARGFGTNCPTVGCISLAAAAAAAAATERDCGALVTPADVRQACATGVEPRMTVSRAEGGSGWNCARGFEEPGRGVVRLNLLAQHDAKHARELYDLGHEKPLPGRITSERTLAGVGDAARSFVRTTDGLELHQLDFVRGRFVGKLTGERQGGRGPLCSPDQAERLARVVAARLPGP